MQLTNILWIVLVALQVLLVTGSEEDITISLLPPLMREGHNFRLTCNFPTIYTFLFWRHNTSQIDESNTRFDVQVQNVGEVYLEISNVIITDAGTYDCVLSNSDGNQVVKSTTTTYLPEVVVTTENGLTYRHFSGETARLICDPLHHNKLQWQHLDGNVISPSSSGGRIRIEDSDLIFTELLLSDNDTYKCVPSNDVSFVGTFYAHLLVYEIPSVVITPNLAIVNLSDSATFTCEVTAYPKANIGWNSQDLDIQLDFGRITVVEVDVNNFMTRNILTFHSVELNDTGTYRCSAFNSNGSSAAIACLLLNGTLSAPQRVHLQPTNPVGINVVWTRPETEKEIDSYTIIWQAAAVNGTIDMSTVDGSKTSFLIADLEPLTNYSVTVYASNSVLGKGRDSGVVYVITGATVPAAPLEVTYTDIGPKSVLVAWQLSEDNGGEPVTTVEIRYREEGSQVWITVSVDYSVISYNVSGLTADTTYELAIAAGNMIGIGEETTVLIFATPPLGYPGIPSGVVAKDHDTDLTAIISWVPSNVGRPFTAYIISSSQRNWTIGSDKVVQQSDGTVAAVIADLMQNTCYHFQVSIQNSVGIGQPSPPSEDYCTKTCDDDCTVDTKDLGTTKKDSGLDSEIVAVLVITCFIGVVLLVIVVLLLWKISATLKQDNSNDYTISNGDSEKGTLQLGNGAFRRQASCGNTSTITISSQNSISGTDSQDTPRTATTIISSQNPFQFPTAVEYPQHRETTFEHPQPWNNGVIWAQTMPGHTFQQTQSIPKTRSLPGHTRWLAPVGEVCMSRVASAPLETLEEDCDMVDNPLNQQFEEEQRAELEGRLRRDSDPEDDVPPPIPPYRGNEDSDTMLPPPYLGESYSQPSPRLQQHGCGFQIPDSDKEEDLEFTENDAYETVRYSPTLGRRNPPLFEIASQERGAVFETVKFRQ